MATEVGVEESISTLNSTPAGEDERQPRQPRTPRPKLSGRKPSTSMIVHRDSPDLELRDQVYDEDDARAMSPRRNSQEVEHLGREVRRALHE